MSLSKERITWLLQAWTSRKSTPAEEKELFDLLSNDGNENLVHSHVQQLVDQYNSNDLVPSIEWEKLYEKILEAREKDQQSAVHRIPVMRRGWFRFAAAAVVLAIIATTVIVLLTNNKPDQSLANGDKLPDDVEAPRASKAMITLADGQKVYLDSAVNGSLATQANVNVVKTSDGQIIYSESSQASPEGGGLEGAYNTLYNPRGSKVVSLTLNDGTQVWLNAGSSVTYPVAFTGTDRKVSITGEAYFEVAHNTSKPFYVTKGDVQIRVLGTHFNVNAYDDEKDIKVTLLEGSVKVSNMIGSNIIKPGEQSRITINNKPQTINSIDLEAVMAWKNGVFNFNKASLQSVMQQLSRWYDVEVVYEKNIPDLQFYGEMQRDLNLSQVLKILEKMEVKFRIEGRKLIVLP